MKKRTLNRSYYLMVFLFAGACAYLPLRATSRAASSGDLVIINAHIFGDENEDSAAVLVRGSKIAKVGQSTALRALCAEPCTEPCTQRIPADLALRVYTTNPAIAIGMGDRLGKIAEGYQADMIILDHDPRQWAAHSVLENPVRMKMVAGVVY